MFLLILLHVACSVTTLHLQKEERAGGLSHAAARVENFGGVSTPHDLPVGGDVWPVAIFWSYIEVGSPPKKFPVAIDSGSSTLDIPLIGCVNCTTKAPNRFYDPASSRTSMPYSCSALSPCKVGRCKDGKCTFSNTYETCAPTDPTEPCTIAGRWFQEEVTLGAGPVNVSFGAIDFQTSNFEQFQNIDGVVGMCGPSLHTSVFGTLVEEGKVSEDVWGMCLHHGKGSNGTLTIGGVDSTLYHGDLQYTPDVGEGFYEMTLEGLVVGSDTVLGVKERIIIDTGTNILLLPDEAYAGMRRTFLALCNSGPSLHGVCDVASGSTLFDKVCYEMTEEQMAVFPNFTLALGASVNLTMSPSDYLLKGYGVKADPRKHCLGVEKTSPGGLQILGDTTLHNYFIAFDRGSKRIGWAPVNKDTCGAGVLL